MLRYITILIISLTFVIGLNAAQITFIILPDTIPQDSAIYIAGNQPDLGEWVPNRVQLTYDGAGAWLTSIRFDKGTIIEYKITRGSWDSEAVDYNGIEFANFEHLVSGDTTLVVKIPNWRDLQRDVVIISKQRFDNKIGRIELFEDWKFHAGDNPLWAFPDFDDTHWEWRNPQNSGQDKWIGIGWFRKQILVDSSTLNKPMGLYLRQVGASEIYLNGEKIYSVGTVANNIDDEEGLINRERIDRYREIERRILEVDNKRKTEELEELMHKVLPLGGPDVSYNQSSTDLASGDTILLMTDGYFELFNKDNEILDLPNVKKFFIECVEQLPQQIIDHLMMKGKEWCKSRPQNDDITFVVVKVK